MEKILTRFKYEVTSVGKGTDVIELLSKHNHFDCIILDRNMPEMNGIETCKSIRSGKAGEENRTIPIVAITAIFGNDEKDEFNKAGINACIQKPVHPVKVINVIAKLIERQQATSVENNQPPDQKEIFDEKELLSRLLNNEALAKAFLEKVIEELPAILSRMEKIQHQALNINEYGDCAHTLKGIALNASAKELYGCAVRMEQYCKNHIDTYSDILLTELQSSLKDAIHAFIAHIQDFLENGTTNSGRSKNH